MSTLYLIRHGQASAGTHDYDRLSSTGQRQARLLGQWWSEQGFAPDATFHGSMVRQKDTASLAMAALDTSHQSTVHEGLNEYDHRVIDSLFGPPNQGMENAASEAMTFDQYVDTMMRWRDSDPSTMAQRAEPWSDFSQRGWSSVKSLQMASADAEHLVFFTSGGVIATILSAVLNLDFTHTIDAIWRIRNASITTLHFDGQQPRLVDFNTVPHLQAQRDPSLITLI